MKIAAVVIGLSLAGLAYLSYRGWVDGKWTAMEDASRSTLTTIHAFHNTETQFAAHPSAVEPSGLPLAATFGFNFGINDGVQEEVEDRMNSLATYWRF